MKSVTKIGLVLILLLWNGKNCAQFNGTNFSLNANFSYTKTSKLYLQPNASDEYSKGIHSNLTDILGGGIELRMKISDYVFIGIGADYISKKDKITPLTVESSYTETILVEDGYSVIPVEISGYYLFPFSFKNVKIYMGGGAGLYFGRHIRNLGDISAETVNSDAGYGIHVLAGLDVFINDFLSIAGNIKFRDVEFSMSNKYDKTEGIYEGRLIRIITQDFDSKVSIDGVMFNIGIAYHF